MGKLPKFLSTAFLLSSIFLSGTVSALTMPGQYPPGLWILIFVLMPGLMQMNNIRGLWVTLKQSSCGTSFSRIRGRP